MSVTPPPRELVGLDTGWRFALGHATDTAKDFGHGTAYFSHLAKAGWGSEGPGGFVFDDRAWRVLDLPHDWVAELAITPQGGHSHGYRRVGRAFPDSSVGWYRRPFFIPEGDRGRRISLVFDGAHRDAQVWVNGFYMGREWDGYSSFRFDVSEVLNYGGANVVAVRLDATLEEGWYYEGAGLYRHAWIEKTGPLHLEDGGTFVRSELAGSGAKLLLAEEVANQGDTAAAFGLEWRVLGPSGAEEARGSLGGLSLAAGTLGRFEAALTLAGARLWSPADPARYTLVTRVVRGGAVADERRTAFGVRSVAFDPDRGFLLNGKPLKIKGVCLHQDHAGVGVALPDSLQEWRLRKVMEFGANAIRCSHNPPTPELLEACDRLGVLALPENRLMGTSPEVLERLRRMVRLHRNRPCVIAWSLGNEEWGIEGNDKGARIAAAMQAACKAVDPSRPCTVAVSGGWDSGIGTVAEVMGFNYLEHGDIDAHHKAFPLQGSLGTEESTTQSTRGVYLTDAALGHGAPTDRDGKGCSVEKGWRYYAERPYLAGLFLWTGFDYHGEPNPFAYPANASQFGVLDLCGFPKDPWQYLRAWWRDEPYVGIAPHWTWPGREGQPVDVWVRANTPQVELLLNGRSLGRKAMPANGHLEWRVPYEPGTLEARGFDGEAVRAKAVERTAGKPAALRLAADRAALKADGRDALPVSVEVVDAHGAVVPWAGDAVTFTLQGPGRILGVGNGDPSSLEPEQFPERVECLPITGLKCAWVGEPGPETQPGFDDSQWAPFRYTQQEEPAPADRPLLAVRGTFNLEDPAGCREVRLVAKSILGPQTLFINGHEVAAEVAQEALGQDYALRPEWLKPGANAYAAVGLALKKRDAWEDRNMDPGVVRTARPPLPCVRRAFNGLAQVLLQAGTRPGALTLRAAAPGLAGAELTLRAHKAALPVEASQPEPWRLSRY